MIVFNKEKDIKILENYGFKPMYDTYTGELTEYFWVREYKYSWYDTIGIRVKKQKESPKKLSIRKIYKVNKESVLLFDEPKVWSLDSSKYDKIDWDKVYELFKDNILVQE